MTQVMMRHDKPSYNCCTEHLQEHFHSLPGWGSGSCLSNGKRTCDSALAEALGVALMMWMSHVSRPSISAACAESRPACALGASLFSVQEMPTEFQPDFPASNFLC